MQVASFIYKRTSFLLWYITK